MAFGFAETFNDLATPATELRPTASRNVSVIDASQVNVSSTESFTSPLNVFNETKTTDHDESLKRPNAKSSRHARDVERDAKDLAHGDLWSSDNTQMALLQDSKDFAVESDAMQQQVFEQSALTASFAPLSTQISQQRDAEQRRRESTEKTRNALKTWRLFGHGRQGPIKRTIQANEDDDEL